MTKILPALLPKSTEELEVMLKNLPSDVDEFQIDIIEEDIWAETEKKFEVHIMAKEPEDLALKWASRKPKRIIVHKLTDRILSLKNICEIGLGIEMSVDIESIVDQIEKVDFVLLMSISEIGAQGREFEPKVFDRIKQVKEKFPHLPIAIDGGVSIENFDELKSLGVDRVTVGSAFKELWSSQMKKLQS